MKKKKNKKLNIYYLVLILVLAIAIAAAFIWAWKSCKKYQDNSASTVAENALEEISDKLNLTLTLSKPKSGSYKSQVYTIYKDKEPIAEFTAEFAENGIMGLALYKPGEMHSLVSYNFVLGDGCRVSAEGKSTDGLSGEDYLMECFESLENVGGIAELPIKKKISVDWAYSFNSLVFSADNADCSLLKLDDNLWYVYPNISKEDSKLIKDRVNLISDYYVRYMSNHLAFDQISPFIVSSSPLRKNLSTQLLRWFGGYTSYTINNVKMSEPMSLGNDYVLINTALDFNVKRNSGKMNYYPLELSYILHKEGNIWKVADLRPNFLYKLEMTEYVK